MSTTPVEPMPSSRPEGAVEKPSVGSFSGRKTKLHPDLPSAMKTTGVAEHHIREEIIEEGTPNKDSPSTKKRKIDTTIEKIPQKTEHVDDAIVIPKTDMLRQVKFHLNKVYSTDRDMTNPLMMPLDEVTKGLEKIKPYELIVDGPRMNHVLTNCIKDGVFQANASSLHKAIFWDSSEILKDQDKTKLILANLIRDFGENPTDPFILLAMIICKRSLNMVVSF